MQIPGSEIRVSVCGLILLGVFFLLQVTLVAPPVCFCTGGVATVVVAENTEISGDRVVLGDIASISGSDPGLVRKIQVAYVGAAPLPGKSRNLDERRLKGRIKQAGIDMSQITFHIPRQVIISRSFIEISTTKTEEIVREFIFETIPWDRNRTTIKSVKAGHNAILSKGRVSYKVVYPKNRALLGKIPLSVQYSVNGKLENTVWTIADIEVLMDVVVTKRPLRRSHVISEDDICLKQMDLAGLSSKVVTNMDLVLGKRTKRKIEPQTILSTNLVEQTPVVKRGDIVNIIAESDGLRITALGEVKGRGFSGERVRVENLDSSKRIYARVIDSNTVKVDF
jgi:flagella basal body P-ring formation protein FlgA